MLRVLLAEGGADLAGGAARRVVEATALDLLPEFQVALKRDVMALMTKAR